MRIRYDTCELSLVRVQRDLPVCILFVRDPALDPSDLVLPERPIAAMFLSVDGSWSVSAMVESWLEKLNVAESTTLTISLFDVDPFCDHPYFGAAYLSTSS